MLLSPLALSHCRREVGHRLKPSLDHGLVFGLIEHRPIVEHWPAFADPDASCASALCRAPLKTAPPPAKALCWVFGPISALAVVTCSGTWKRQHLHFSNLPIHSTTFSLKSQAL